MSIEIHLARWLVPVTSPIMEDAGIAVRGGRILSVDRRAGLLRQFPRVSRITDHGDSIMIPGLVNAHCHLELSSAKGLMPEGAGFSAWLREVMKFRQCSWNPGGKDVLAAARDAFLELRENGVTVLGDTGNSDVGERVFAGMNDGKEACFVNFREVIHPLPGVPELPGPSALGKNGCPSAHSVYTCSRETLAGVKKWCRKKNMPFSIHCAESMEEMEFVRASTGPLAEILKERGRDVQAFFKTSSSPVRLLEEAGVLDSSTVCVHCVFLEGNDLEILSERGCNVCLCPGSNEFIGSGTAPFAEFFSSMPERVCLGTDSLASNWRLSIFQEMERIIRHSPGVSPEPVLRAATINGARALGMSSVAGSLEPGKRALFLVIQASPRGGEDLYEYICCGHGAFPLKVVASI